MNARIRVARVEDPGEAATIERWIAERGDATPFHRPAWMRAITRACGHSTHYLVRSDVRGNIIGVLPLHEVHSGLFGRALASSGFAVSGGIVADDSETVSALTDAAVDLSRRLSCPSLELRGGALPDAPGWHIDRDSYAGFVRDIAGDDDGELLAIPRKQRAEVRRALGLNLDIRIGSDDIDIAEHYSVYSESVRNLGTPVFPAALFRAVLDEFRGDADILTVRSNGEAVASVLSLYHRGTVMPYWGGGRWSARALRANDLMYFALMQHARERGCHSFDFGRSKFGTGAFAFKKNWGFEPQPLSYAVRTADGAAPRAINPLNPKYRLQIALWQRLPLGIANRIGPMIARGLG